LEGVEKSFEGERDSLRGETGCGKIHPVAREWKTRG
jgi:hypothetical protein